MKNYCNVRRMNKRNSVQVCRFFPVPLSCFWPSQPLYLEVDMRHHNKWLPGITTTKQYVPDSAIRMFRVMLEVNQCLHTKILWYTFETQGCGQESPKWGMGGTKMIWGVCMGPLTEVRSGFFADIFGQIFVFSNSAYDFIPSGSLNCNNAD